MFYRKGLIVSVLALLFVLALAPGQAATPVWSELQHYRADELPPGLTSSDWRQILGYLQYQTREMAPLYFYPGRTIALSPLTQQFYLKSSNTGGGDELGWSVAISGDTVVVGAPYEDSNATGVNGNQADNSASDAGAVYVFTRSGITWSQQAYLKASNTAGGDEFGFTVAISGDTIVVGAVSEDSNATGINGNQANNSASDAGAAYVFTRSGTTWSQQAYLKASNTGSDDVFGRSVAISGDTVVVGARFEDSSATGVNGDQSDNSALDAGAAYVFTRSGTTWSQQAYLKASNTSPLDELGFAVAISGNTIALGAFLEDSNATGVNGNQANNSASDAGAAYVFTRSGTTWSQQAYLKASNADEGDEFGFAVGISNDTIVVGASREDSSAIGVNGNQADNSASNAGAAYVFTRSGTTWSQQAYLKASNTGASDFFGSAVEISNDTTVVGAQFEDSSATGVNGDQTNNSALDAGAAYVFTRSGTTWSQQAYLKASNTGALDELGSAVGVSGNTIALGAFLEDSNATGVNGDQTNNSASDAGAVYMFVSASSVYLPLVVKPAPTNLYIKNSTTGTASYRVRNTPQGDIICSIPSSTTQLCGNFSPGYYTVSVSTSQCGASSGQVIFPSGDVTREIRC